jgi:hypothetical protein
VDRSSGTTTWHATLNHLRANSALHRVGAQLLDAGIVNRTEPERRRTFDQGWAVIARDGRLSQRGRAAVAGACGYYVQGFPNVTCKVRRADIGQIP